MAYSFHRQVRSRTKESFHEFKYYGNVAKTLGLKYQEVAQQYELINREGDELPSGLASRVESYRADWLSYRSAAEDYRRRTVNTIRELLNEQGLPMAEIASYRANIGYGYLWAQHRERMADWGKRFGEALRDEDESEFISLLDDMRGTGMNLAYRAMDKMLSRYDDETNCRPWLCPCCDTYQRSDDSTNTVYDRHGDSADWCDSCVSDSATESDVMGCYIADDDRCRLFTDCDSFDDNDCNDYVTREFAIRQGYNQVSHPTDGSLAYVDDEVYQYWNERYNDSDNGLWYQYHSGNRVGHIPSDADKMKVPVYLGVEVEFEFTGEGDEDEVTGEERDNRRRFAKAFRRAGMNSYAVLERDGSLTCGLEAITGYTGLDVHRKRLPQLLQLAMQNDAVNEAATTGLHVHVSKKGMTPLHLAKLSELIYKAGNRHWIEAIAGRNFGNYREAIDHKYQISQMCKRAKQMKREGHGYDKSTQLNYIVQGMGCDVTRYAALSFNTSTGETVEFRMFQGSLDFERVMAYIEFAHACWHFSQQYPMRDMNPQAFAKFICRADQRASTKALRAYMKQFDSHLRTEEARYVKPVTGTSNKKLRKAATI